MIIESKTRIVAAILACLSAADLLAQAQTSQRLLDGTPSRVSKGSIAGRFVPGPGAKDTTSDAKVILLGTAFSALTDEHGNFEFLDIPPGVYEVSATKPGFAPLKIVDVSVDAGKSLTLTTEMLQWTGSLSVEESQIVTISAKEEVMTLVPYVVNYTTQKPFQDKNADITRTIDDPQPYYIYGGQQIVQSGAVNLEDFMKSSLTVNSNPQNNSQQYRQNLGATSSFNLRGQGTNQTLILINGRRAASVNFVGTSLQADLNTIPLAAIDRVEVLPSAASGIYGASAVGGVINVVLKKHYIGGEIRATYSNTTNSDTPIQTINAAYGFDLHGGKTQVMFSLMYSDQSRMLVKDRSDIVGRNINRILSNSPAFFYSANIPFWGATPNIASANGSMLVLKNGTPLNSSLTFVPAGSAPGADLTAAYVANAGKNNLELADGTGQYGLKNTIGFAPTAKSFMASVRREINSRLEFFADFSRASNVAEQTYNVLSRTNFAVPATAPTNPFLQNILISIPLDYDTDFVSRNQTTNFAVGFQATLPRDWKGMVDFTWSKGTLSYAFDSYDSTTLTTSLHSALAAGRINPFVDTLKFDPGLRPYLVPLITSNPATLGQLGLRASGPLYSLPWGEINLTAGAEHRKEALGDGYQYAPYTFSPTATFLTQYFGQSQSTDSVYAELDVPVVTARNRKPFLHGLDLQLAARSEFYEVKTRTAFYRTFPAAPDKNAYSGPIIDSTIKDHSTNPTFGMRLFVTKDFILRASYSTSFVLPTFSQLLPNQIPQLALTNVVDPKTNKTYGVSTLIGGSPDLQPQVGTDFNAGAIFQPKSGPMQGLRIGFEYYKFHEKNLIARLTPQQLVSFEDQFPSRVTRDANTGLVTLVNTSFLNLTNSKEEGFDLTLEYGKRTALGTFHVYSMFSQIESIKKQTTFGSPYLEYAGYVASGGPAKRRATARVTWRRNNWGAGWNVAFVDGYYQMGATQDPVYNGNPSAPRITLYTAAQGAEMIPSQTYHSAFVSYSFPHSLPKLHKHASAVLSGTEITIGVKNLLNKLPPLDTFYTPYFYSPYGDARLREVWISVKKTF